MADEQKGRHTVRADQETLADGQVFLVR